jgi:hypothetical protein
MSSSIFFFSMLETNKKMYDMVIIYIKHFGAPRFVGRVFTLASLFAVDFFSFVYSLWSILRRLGSGASLTDFLEQS